jgi:hypothetical protein
MRTKRGGDSVTKLLTGILALVAMAHAADITGTWSGSASMTRDNETRDDTALLMLKQNGAQITGTIGPNEGRRMEITKGSAEGNTVYIEAIVEGENKIVLRLKLDGEKLVGDLKAEGPTAPPLTGKLNLSRQK